MQSVMELLTCPHCGCSVQASETSLGRTMRCFGCQKSFVATNVRVAAPRPDPLADHDKPEGVNGIRAPFCPGCGKRIAWSDLQCPHCGEELEAEDEKSARRVGYASIRRDGEPHRAALIAALGNVSAILSGLGICTFGFTAWIGVPLGILTVALADRDLQKMREGRMDPNGKHLTQSARAGGIAGTILGLLFAFIFALVYLAK